MAEIIGVVASGISIATLAAQIAQSVARLKSYWDEIQDAPSEISILIEEIETFQILLEDIQNDQYQNDGSGVSFNSPGASKCLELCTKGSNGLREVVDELGTEIRASRGFRRKWASAKYVYRKHKVEQHKARLERSIRFLNLAYQIYMRDLICLQPQKVVAQLRNESERAWDRDRIPNFNSVETYPRSNNNQAECATVVLQTPKATKLAKKQTRILQYRFQNWWSTSAWEFVLATSHLGWDFKLWSYNIRPVNSKPFLLAREGDIDGLQTLFQSGLASPLDIDEDGDDMLDVAIMYGKTEMCRFLVYHGVESRRLIQREDLLEPQHIWQLLSNGSIMHPPPAQVIEVLDILTTEAHLDFDDYILLKHFRGPLEVFLRLKERIQASCITLPTPEICVEVAISIAYESTGANSPLTVRCALPSGEVTSWVAKYARNGETLLHSVAFAIGVCISCHDHIPDAKPNGTFRKDLADWRSLCQDLLANGANPFLEGYQDWWRLKRSCLLQMLDSYLLCHLGNPALKSLKTLPRIWAEELERGGFDLLDCGRREVELHTHNPKSKTFRFTWYSGHYNYFTDLEVRLYGLKYGSTPLEWEFWLSEPRDTFAGDFWNMVDPLDDSELLIPGMWVD